MDTRRSNRLYRFLATASLAVLVLMSLSGVALANRETPIEANVVALPAGANVVDVTPDRTVTNAYPNIESRLAQMMAAARAGDQAQLATFAGERYLDVAQQTARVILQMSRSPEAHAIGGPTYEVVTQPNGATATIVHLAQTAVRAELAAAIAATGATYELAVDNLVQVLAPLDSIEALSKIADVAYVRLPYPAKEDEVPAAAQARPIAGPAAPQVGTYTTEGSSLTNTNDYNIRGYDGTGIKLAIFDFGFTNYAARQASGDLPAAIVAVDASSAFDFAANTAGFDHGTACAEIAYDMAPAAAVYLIAFYTDVEFAAAVDTYKDAAITGKKVATMSIGWYNAGPYDGTSDTTSGITTKVDQAAAAGIFWAKSAGNSRMQHHSWTSAQYSTGNTVAFGASNIEGYGPLGTTGVYLIPAGTEVTAFLEWNDWNASRTGNNSHVDYDLYLWQYVVGTGW